jgi:DNA-binding PadR family transcriptional regulator
VATTRQLSTPSPSAYGVLGLLAVRSWTGYELTQQVRRSLAFVWPTSEGHLYREQKALVARGWASVVDESTGRRTRKRYAISDAGRAALADWLATAPGPPQLHVEAVLRAFYADQGEVADLLASLRATAQDAADQLDQLRAFVDEYLADGGPLDQLEAGNGGPQDRLEFRGRPMFPERLPAVALALDASTRLLESVELFCLETTAEVETWSTTHGPSLASDTRRRLEAIRARLAARRYDVGSGTRSE